jgi:uncharacterized protein
MSTQLDDTQLAHAIAEYLDSHTVLNLATTGPQGAHAASVFYARKDFELFWFSDPGTRHSRDLAIGVGCAGTITDNLEDYTKIQGLQLQGVGEELPDPADRQVGLDALNTKYTFMKEFAAGPGAAQMDKVSVYRFRPLTITWIDNTVSFGFKQTLDFEV